MPLVLEDYLRIELPRQKEELDQVFRTTRAVLENFHRAFDPAALAFPYQVDPGTSPVAANPFSFSTNSMIVLALKLVTGAFQGRDIPEHETSLITPLLCRTPDHLLSEALQGTFHVISDNLANRLEREVEALLKQNGALTDSTTFGTNDPFSLSWILETVPTFPKHDHWLRPITPILQSAFSDPESYRLQPREGNVAPVHALPLLRLVHVYNRLRQLTKAPSVDLAAIQKWFETRLHLHLSYATIRDSGFDAPELVFALEGILICDPNAHGQATLLERVAAVLSEKQQTNPNLRPYRPMTASARGQSLLPLTIEVFNSLLRSLEHISAVRHQIFSTLRPVLTRYVQWLLGQHISIPTPLGPVAGWHSEHTQTLRCIHTWQTSQVLFFLMHYHAWLQHAVQEDVLDATNFSVNRNTILQDWMPETEGASKDAEPHQTERVYEPLWNHYIHPRRSLGKREPHYGLLLFGPPGTGKTEIVEWLAHQLRWPLISITPSDFIVRGGQLVEARAKAIFRALDELRDVVVFFDEIDRLLLDRDSPLYRKQQDIFQFMTPSMLPKLANLRRSRRCIFVIGTNYEERIDSAIKRRGRIDDHILLLPPGAIQRRRQIQIAVKRLGFGDLNPLDPLLDAAVAAAALRTGREIADQLADLVDAAGSAGELLSAFVAHCATHAADIRLLSYEKRFTGPQMPVREYLSLYADYKAAIGAPTRLLQDLAARAVGEGPE